MSGYLLAVEDRFLTLEEILCPRLKRNRSICHERRIPMQKVTTKMSSNLLVLILMVVALFATACNNTTTTGSSAAATVAPATSVVESPATDTSAAETITAPAAESAQESTSESTAATITKLDLNTVTGDELLATIPDFGARMVREFDEYRPYVSIQEFRREIGKYVDDAQVAFYEQYVYVPIRINDSDADTLMQIPNLDATAADALIAARPFDSNDAFLQKLAEVAPAIDATVAQGYLEAQ